MRRIDLFCKLMGPLTISLVAITSNEIAIWTTLAMSIASVFVEYVFIEQVYQRVNGLQRQPLQSSAVNLIEPDLANDDQGLRSKVVKMLKNILPIDSLPFYFTHPAFMPSFALSLLYLTVLSFSGQMITYLLLVGYSPLYIGIARVVSSIFELSATWLAPPLMKRIGLIRAGMWSVAWQMGCLAAALALYFHGGLDTNNIFSATGLAVGVAFSRVGLWGFDLCAQNIIQDVGISITVFLIMTKSDPIYRKSMMSIAGHSPPSRLLFKTCLNSSRTLRPLYSHVRINSSGQSLSVWSLFIQQAACTLRSFEEGVGIFYMRRVVSAQKSRIEHSGQEGQLFEL